MSYLFNRVILEKDGYKLGFEFLPHNYDKLDRHAQNNKYMCAMWENENEHLQEAIYFCEYGDLEK